MTWKLIYLISLYLSLLPSALNHTQIKELCDGSKCLYMLSNQKSAWPKVNAICIGYYNVLLLCTYYKLIYYNNFVRKTNILKTLTFLELSNYLTFIRYLSNLTMANTFGKIFNEMKNIYTMY